MSKEKRKRIVPIWVGIIVFVICFAAGVVSKGLIKPSWTKKYEVNWNDSLGTLMEDVSYGPGDANMFDLYLPNDAGKENYGLVVYLHAGGFTSGDKTDDRQMLSWLCGKGYVACGINYTLRTDDNNVSVFDQSNEIRAAIPVVINTAESAGYHIDRMAMAGGSAGHALSMIYAYRDGNDAPVPVVLAFGAVGPSCFYVEDWGIYGLDQDTDEARQAAAGLFGVTAGVELTADDIRDGSYVEIMKPISAAAWVSENPIPTVVAYGTCDKVQPFAASLRLRAALEDNGVDYMYFELPHSGHGLQNDYAIYRQYMEAVEDYLDKYMPAYE